MAVTLSGERQSPPCCPLCQTTESSYAFAERGYDLRRCHLCGLFFIWPYPDTETMKARVSSYAYDDLTVLAAEKHHQASVTYYETLFPRIEHYYRQGRSALDVGAGTGRLLELVKTRYPHVALYGIELNQERAAYARRLAGAVIYEESILDVGVERTYDVISLVNVFSHVPVQPLFDKIALLLSEGGTLIIETGEIRPDVVKSNLHDWGIPDHIQFLGMDTLAHIARRWKLEVQSHERRSVADVLFSRQSFAMQGRSRLRNTVKRVALAVPFSIPLLRAVYKLWKGERLYSSLIVMRRGGP